MHLGEKIDWSLAGSAIFRVARGSGGGPTPTTLIERQRLSLADIEAELVVETVGEGYQHLFIDCSEMLSLGLELAEEQIEVASDRSKLMQLRK